MKKSLTVHRPIPDTRQTERAFCKRVEQDLYKIQCARKNVQHVPAYQIVHARIERIQFALPLYKHFGKRLTRILQKYEALFSEIQNEAK